MFSWVVSSKWFSIFRYHMITQELNRLLNWEVPIKYHIIIYYQTMVSNSDSYPPTPADARGSAPGNKTFDSGRITTTTNTTTTTTTTPPPPPPPTTTTTPPPNAAAVSIYCSCSSIKSADPGQPRGMTPGKRMLSLRTARCCSTVSSLEKGCFSRRFQTTR